MAGLTRTIGVRERTGRSSGGPGGGLVVGQPFWVELQQIATEWSGRKLESFKAEKIRAEAWVQPCGDE